jgi:predicted nucleic acid-binding protein
MIVVDTSVWVQSLRGKHPDTADTLRQLLDADDVALPLPVRIELMSGVGRRDRASLRRALSSLPVVFPTEETWRRLERWVERAAEAGEHFAVTDLLIAALADDVDGLIWSLDDDFARMARLKIARLYQ